MIAALASSPLGTITWLPCRVRNLVARQVISTTSPSQLPELIQCPTWKGFSTWIARPGHQVAQRVLQREARHHRADRRRREELLLHHERRDHRKQDEHQDVLHDGREVVRHPVRPAAGSPAPARRSGSARRQTAAGRSRRPAGAISGRTRSDAASTALMPTNSTPSTIVRRTRLRTTRLFVKARTAPASPMRIRPATTCAGSEESKAVTSSACRPS